MSGYAKLRRRPVRDLLRRRQRPEVTRSALAVLALLATEASIDDGQVEMTDEDIGRPLGLSARQAAHARQVLAELGAIRIVRRGRGGGRSGAPRAQLISLDVEPGADVEHAPEVEPVEEQADVQEAPETPELFQVPQCSAQGCKSPAEVEGRCLFCARVWPTWSGAHAARDSDPGPKDASRKAWRAATRKKGNPAAGVIADRLAEHAARHAAHTDADGFLPMPPRLRRWLDEKRWESPPPTARPSGGNSRSTPRTVEGGRDETLDEKLAAARQRAAEGEVET